MTFVVERRTETSAANIVTFIDMLSYRRPAGSDTEKEFIAKFIKPLGAWPDTYGNWWLFIDNPDGTPSPIMWSSHTDSVHHKPGRQKIKISVGGVATLADPKGEKTNCLGADCATGVWLMAEMIEAKVPGLYLFHAEEEAGGMGSGWLAANMADMITHIKFAIALDRKGQQDVITHQGGDRSASDAFARSLARVLNGIYPEILPLDFKPCDGGVFTDTAQYTRLIPECTNLSVGYERQHGPTESQDLDFLVRLRDVLVQADFSTLVCERDPKAVESKWWEDDDYNLGRRWDDHPRDLKSGSPLQRMYELVRNYPWAVAQLLDQQGFDPDEVEEFTWKVMDEEEEIEL